MSENLCERESESCLYVFLRLTRMRVSDGATPGYAIHDCAPDKLSESAERVYGEDWDVNRGEHVLQEIKR